MDTKPDQPGSAYHTPTTDAEMAELEEVRRTNITPHLNVLGISDESRIKRKGEPTDLRPDSPASKYGHIGGDEDAPEGRIPRGALGDEHRHRNEESKIASMLSSSSDSDELDERKPRQQEKMNETKEERRARLKVDRNSTSNSSTSPEDRPRPSEKKLKPADTFKAPTPKASQVAASSTKDESDDSDALSTSTLDSKKSAGTKKGKGGRRRTVATVDPSIHRFNLTAFFKNQETEAELLDVFFEAYAKQKKMKRYDCSNCSSYSAETTKQMVAHSQVKHRTVKDNYWKDNILKFSSDDVLEVSKQCFNYPAAILPYMGDEWKNANGRIYEEYEKEIEEILRMREEARDLPLENFPSKYNIASFQGQKRAQDFKDTFTCEFRKMKGVDRFFCNRCSYSGIRADTAQRHCVDQHGKETKYDYEDKIRDWTMEDVKEVMLFCFGDLDFGLKWMPPQWRDTHPETMRAQAQRRIHQVETEKKQGVSETKEEDAGKETDEIADNALEVGRIRCLLCPNSISTNPEVLLDHFCKEYQEKYEQFRYSCTLCDEKRWARSMSKHCKKEHGDPSAYIDHIKEFPLDYVSSLSRYCFNDPEFIIPYLPRAWFEARHPAFRQTSRTALQQSNDVLIDYQRKQRTPQIKTSGVVKTDEDVAKLLLMLKDSTKMTDELSKQLDSVSMNHKIGKFYFLLRADKLPEDRTKITEEEFVRAAYYVGLTEVGDDIREDRSIVHFKDARGLFSCPSMDVKNRRKCKFIVELSRGGIETMIVKVDTKLKLLVAEAAEATTINFLFLAGRLVNANRGKNKDELKGWDGEERLRYAAHWIYRAIDQARTGRIMRVRPEYITDLAITMNEGIIIEDGQAEDVQQPCCSKSLDK